MCTINRHLRFPQDVDETQDLAKAPLRGLAKRKLRSKRASLSSWQKLWRTTFLGCPEMSCVQQFYRPSGRNLDRIGKIWNCYEQAEPPKSFCPFSEECPHHPGPL